MKESGERLSRSLTKRPVFGRHETFHLRYGWLTKGAQALRLDPQIFESDGATVELGVGKNMVRSIRHWLLATQQIQESSEKGMELTQIGKKILGERGKDPYLENNNTIWLLHWLLVSDAGQAASWYWFFNKFHKPEFTSQELAVALKEFTAESQWKVAASTLKQDINVMLRMYTETLPNSRIPMEDALDSPMAVLGLIKKLPYGRKYRSELATDRPISDYVLGYALAEMFEAVDAPALSREVILHGDEQLPGIGSVFRMSEGAVEAAVERLVASSNGRWDFRSTAGVSQLFQLDSIPKTEFLKKIYARKSTRIAA